MLKGKNSRLQAVVPASHSWDVHRHIYTHWICNNTTQKQPCCVGEAGISWVHSTSPKPWPQEWLLDVVATLHCGFVSETAGPRTPKSCPVVDI